MDWNSLLFGPYDAFNRKWASDETFRKVTRWLASVVVTAMAGWAMDLPPKAIVLAIAPATGLLINAGNFNLTPTRKGP